MDGTAAISSNLEALKRILAGLVSMAGLGPHPEVRAEGEPRRTLPRHLHRAILRLLRPAEAAARRLIIAAAHGLVVVLPPAGKPSRKPATMEPLLRRFGIAVVMSPADLARTARILPRSRGMGTAEGGGGGGVPHTLTSTRRGVRLACRMASMCPLVQRHASCFLASPARLHVRRSHRMTTPSTPRV